MKAWKAELNDLLKKIERHTATSLWRIKKEFVKLDLTFDRKFRKRFLRMTNNRLSEVYERIEIESLAASRQRNHGPIHRNISDRIAKLHPIRDVESSKQRLQSDEKLSTKVEKIQNAITQRFTDIRKRLGRKVINETDKNELSNVMFPVKVDKTRPIGANPFRSRQTSGTDEENTFCEFEINTEVESLNSSPGNRCTRKRKHNIETETEDDNAKDRERKKRKVNEDNNDSGKEENITSLDDMTFFCVHCTDNNKFYESISGATIEDSYGHWLSGHTDLKKVKPFWFYVASPLACFYCGVVFNYRQLVEHHQDIHANETFVSVTPTDRNECGLCQYKGNGLIDHFKAEHEGLIQSQLFNPARLPEKRLVLLFAIDIHKKRQCGHCDEMFETQHEIEAHHSIEHNGELDSKKYFDSQSAYVICDYCSCKVDGTQFFYHIENHRYEFPCSKCDFITKSLVDLLIHEKDKHRTNSLNYHCFEFSDSLRKQFFNSKIVFGNGLVLTNHNFRNTIYDDSKQFDTFIESLITNIKRKFIRIMEKIQMRETEKGISSRAPSIVSYKSESVDRVCFTSDGSHCNPFRVSSMPSIITELEQQNQLDNNLEILGFPRFRNENLMDMFKLLCKKLKAKISNRDIVHIHRTSGVNEPVIVKFRKSEFKIMLKNCAHTTDIWSNDLFELSENEKPTKIFVNWHTTRFYGKMLNIAREAKKSKSLYSYYLCTRGLIVKRTVDSRERVVLSVTQLMDCIYNDKKSKRSSKEQKNLSHSHPE